MSAPAGAAGAEAAGERAIFDQARRDRRPLFDAARLQRTMTAHGQDALIAVSAANVTFTGGVWVPHPLLSSFVVTTASGEQCVVINEADEYYFDEYSWIEDVRGFRQHTGRGHSDDVFALDSDVPGAGTLGGHHVPTTNQQIQHQLHMLLIAGWNACWLLHKW